MDENSNQSDWVFGLSIPLFSAQPVSFMLHMPGPLTVNMGGK